MLFSLDDRMDSYFLAETTKYLFLLFDHALVPDGHTQLHGNASMIWAQERQRNQEPPSTSPPAAASAAGAAAGAPNPAADLVPTPPTAIDDTDGECAAGTTACDGDASADRVDVGTETLPFAVTQAHRLALRVRAPRGGVAAMPLDPAATMFTTEGHVVPLRVGAAGVCGSDGAFPEWKDDVCALHPPGSHMEEPGSPAQRQPAAKRRARARKSVEERLSSARQGRRAVGGGSLAGVAEASRHIRVAAPVDHLRIAADSVTAVRSPGKPRHHGKAKAKPTSKPTSKSKPKATAPAVQGGAKAAGADASTPRIPPPIAISYSRRSDLPGDGNGPAGESRVALVQCDGGGCFISAGPVHVKLTPTRPCLAAPPLDVCAGPRDEERRAQCPDDTHWGRGDASLYAPSSRFAASPAQFGAQVKPAGAWCRLAGSCYACAAMRGYACAWRVLTRTVFAGRPSAVTSGCGGSTCDRLHTAHQPGPCWAQRCPRGSRRVFFRAEGTCRWRHVG